MTDVSKAETHKNYVVVTRDHRGLSIVGGKLYRDRVLASIAAAGIEDAIVLPARRKRLHIESCGSQPERKSILSVDWSACADLSRYRGERWYAVRVAPGSQTMARPVPDGEPRRLGESIVERNLRQAGIDVYSPSFWREHRRHRGGKLREQRLPFLVGYVFIRRDPGLGLRAVRDVDGVVDIVSVGERPVPVSEEDVRFLMIAMFDRHQGFVFQKAQKTEEARFKRKQTLNTELGRHLPKGRGRTVSLRVYADECLASLPGVTRARIMGIVSALDGLEQDNSLDDFREPV